MAGNEAEQLEQQEFYIDSIAPVIEITGVINDSANAGEVQPVVTVLEEHFNAEETRISLVNGKGEQIEIPAQVQQVIDESAVDYAPAPYEYADGKLTVKTELVTNDLAFIRIVK